jgi:small subunit ribosomal protein S19e
MAVSKQQLIIAISKELKPVLKKPDWAEFVKTGTHKEKPPVDPDWWYMRAASVLLKVEKLGPVGVSKLRTKYGGRKNLGVAPEHFRKGSGNIIRKALQQLEKEGYLKKETGKHKGRTLTGKAKSLIAKLEKNLEKAKPKVEAKETAN